jgi:hypothetical protein
MHRYDGTQWLNNGMLRLAFRAAGYAERSSSPLGVYSRNAHFYASII